MVKTATHHALQATVGPILKIKLGLWEGSLPTDFRMKTLDKSDQLANRYQETEVSVVWKLWRALLLRTVQQVNSKFPVWIHYLFKTWDYPNGVATLFLLLQQVSGETPCWRWVSIWFSPIVQLLFWKRFQSVSKKRNEALSEAVYCLNVWSFHEQYQQSFCFTFENIRIGLPIHLWVLFKHIFSVFPVNKETPSFSPKKSSGYDSRQLFFSSNFMFFCLFRPKVQGDQEGMAP